MKNLGIIIVAAFLMASCDSTPGRNKDVLPVVHDGVAEEMDHHDDAHEGHGHEGHDAHGKAQEGHVDPAHGNEKSDSVTVHEHTTAEKKDSAH